MRFGYLTLNALDGIRPDDLARELEQRGFDSIWVPEHSHIPTSRATPYPAGGALPDGYWNNMDPFVSLAMAAQVTTDLELCTGVCLLLEHDVLDLACTTATLDALTGGRLTLGVGVGWNEEELANHRPELPFKLRYSAMEERVEALRVAWSEDEAAFEGRWDRFEESWIYPKPADGTIPVALGNAGYLALGLGFALTAPGCAGGRRGALAWRLRCAYAALSLFVVGRLVMCAWVYPPLWRTAPDQLPLPAPLLIVSMLIASVWMPIYPIGLIAWRRRAGPGAR